MKAIPEDLKECIKEITLNGYRCFVITEPRKKVKELYKYITSQEDNGSAVYHSDYDIVVMTQSFDNIIARQQAAEVIPEAPRTMCFVGTAYSKYCLSGQVAFCNIFEYKYIPDEIKFDGIMVGKSKDVYRFTIVREQTPEEWDNFISGIKEYTARSNYRFTFIHKYDRVIRMMTSSYAYNVLREVCEMLCDNSEYIRFISWSNGSFKEPEEGFVEEWLSTYNVDFYKR